MKKMQWEKKIHKLQDFDSAKKDVLAAKVFLSGELTAAIFDYLHDPKRLKEKMANHFV